jgi:hypothetical protein
MARAKRTKTSKPNSKPKNAPKRRNGAKALVAKRVAAKTSPSITKTKAKRRRVGAPGPTPLPSIYLGQVTLFGFPFAPQGWAPCGGQLLPISQYVPLFQLIGTTYGGNGTSTFMLPNLAPPTFEGPSYFIALQGAIPAR